MKESLALGETVLRLDPASRSLSCLEVQGAPHRSWYPVTELHGFLLSKGPAVPDEGEENSSGKIVLSLFPAFPQLEAPYCPEVYLASPSQTLTFGAIKVDGSLLRISTRPLLLTPATLGKQITVSVTVHLLQSDKGRKHVKLALVNLPEGFACEETDPQWVSLSPDGPGSTFTLKVDVPSSLPLSIYSRLTCGLELRPPRSSTSMGRVPLPITFSRPVNPFANDYIQFGVKSRQFTFKLASQEEEDLGEGWGSAAVPPALVFLAGLPHQFEWTVYFTETPPALPSDAACSSPSEPPAPMRSAAAQDGAGPSQREEGEGGVRPVVAALQTRSRGGSPAPEPAAEVPLVSPPTKESSPPPAKKEPTPPLAKVSSPPPPAKVSSPPPPVKKESTPLPAKESSPAPPAAAAAPPLVSPPPAQAPAAEEGDGAEAGAGPSMPAKRGRGRPKGSKKAKAPPPPPPEKEKDEEAGGIALEDRTKREVEVVKAAVEDPEIPVPVPFSMVTYNALSVGREGKEKALLAQALLSVPYGRLEPLRRSHGKQQLDVIALQEFKGEEGKMHFLELMRDTGYDYVTSGEHAILWQRATMERVADFGSDRQALEDPITEPDFVWSMDFQGEAMLERAWGLPESPEVEGEFTRVFNELKEDYANSKSEGAMAEEHKHFFRYPPITVLLRRRWPETGTVYAITSVHTPGSNTRYEKRQLEREVTALLKPSWYKAVMTHITQRTVAQRIKASSGARAKYLEDRRERFEAAQARLKELTGPKNEVPIFAPHTARTDVLHLVVGDFNTHLYSGSDLKEGLRPRRHTDLAETLSKFKGWYAEHGSDATFDIPSTASKFPDAAYIWLPKALVGHVSISSNVLDIPKSAASSRLFAGGSDHKPMFVDVIERIPEACIKMNPLSKPATLSPEDQMAMSILADLPKALTEQATSPGMVFEIVRLAMETMRRAAQEHIEEELRRRVGLAETEGAAKEKEEKVLTHANV